MCKHYRIAALPVAMKNDKKERKMKRIISVILVLLAASGILFAGGGQSGGSSSGSSSTVAFHYWADEQRTGFENIVNIFKQKNPNINVELTLIPGRDPYYVRLQASLPVGTGPDIMTHNSNIADFLDYLYVLDDFLPGSGIDLSKFPKSIVDFYTFNGKLYAIPKDFDTIAVFYNKELFDRAGVPYPKAGWNWDDLSQTARRLTQGNVMGFGMDVNDAQVGWGNFTRQQRGGPVHNPSVGVNVNDSTMIEALEFLRKLMFVDRVMVDGNTIAETNASDLFMSERVAMITHGSWKVGPFYEAMGDKLGVVEMPAGRNLGCQINGLGFALSKSTRSFDASFELLKFLATLEGQAATAQVVIPAYEGAANSWLAAYPTLDLKVFLDSVRFAYTEAPYPRNSRATNAILIDYISGINMSPNVNIKAELDKAQAEMITSSR